MAVLSSYVAKRVRNSNTQWTRYATHKRVAVTQHAHTSKEKMEHTRGEARAPLRKKTGTQRNTSRGDGLCGGGTGKGGGCVCELNDI